MTVAGRLRPGIVLHIEFLPKIDELLRDSLDKFSRRNAGFRSGLLDFLAVLIHAGQEKHIFTFQPMIASNNIGQDLFVGVTNMWR